jgi:hypothetical protein
MSKLTITAPVNANYCATVVSLTEFRELANCDNVKAAIIFGNSVIVGKDQQVGDVGLFFPVETALSKEFMSYNNLFRKSAQSAEGSNIDPDKAGFFEQHGRVKAVKFRGHKSEGFWIPISSLDYIQLGDVEWIIGASFDKIDTYEICKKYMPKMNPARQFKAQGRLARLEDDIAPNQFRFHFDTENLRRNIHKIQPTDIISISEKWHGTSVVISKPLTRVKLKWYERLLQKLGINIQTQEYGLVYSSRRVIKAVNGKAKQGRSFYTSDVWGAVAQEVEEKIPAGFTLYGEIVGYTPDGAEIQKGYTYGCAPGEHRFLVYRVTFTNEDGYVVELSWPQMREFCENKNIEVVPTLYYGHAIQFYDRIDAVLTTQAWQQELLGALESAYVCDQMCCHNCFKVPAEGIVVRIDRLNGCESYKLKNFRFLEWESKALDKDVVDIEMEESIAS